MPGEELGQKRPARAIRLGDQHQGLVDPDEVLEPLTAQRAALETRRRQDLELAPVLLEEGLSHRGSGNGSDTRWAGGYPMGTTTRRVEEALF